MDFNLDPDELAHGEADGIPTSRDTSIKFGNYSGYLVHG